MDPHINDVILQGLRGSPNSVAFTLLWGNLEDYPIAVSIALKQSNLNIIAKNGAVISSFKGNWKIFKDEPDLNYPKHVITIIHDKKENTWTPTVHLGDFCCLGKFLLGISGNKLV